MNRYELHIYRDIVINGYMRTWLKTHRAYCHVDELIANPAIFPEQTLSLEQRVAWAKANKQAGCVWIVTSRGYHPDCDFSLAAISYVPPMKYRHISKVWRRAYESV